MKNFRIHPDLLKGLNHKLGSWRQMLACMMALLFSLTLFPNRVQSFVDQAQPGHVAGEILVRFRPGINPLPTGRRVTVGAASLDTLLQRYGVTAAEQLFPGITTSNTGMERIYKLSLAPQTDLLMFLAALTADDAIEYAELNYIYHTLEMNHNADQWAVAHAESDTLSNQSVITPTDPLYAYQWALYNPNTANSAKRIDIHAPEAWSLTTGAAELLIAVIDSGIDYTHADLKDGRVRTDIDKDYVHRDDDAMDDAGHGTHVAGIIAAAGNNDVGVAGVLWQTQLLPLKVCDATGSCTIDAVASAIRYAADQGVQVINMSLGSSACSETLAAAIDYAYFEKGVVLVAAAGNSNDLVGYPAGYEPVIAVGALDRHGKRAFFSNYGDALDLAAPGVSIFSTVPNHGYDSLSGTSMAAPHVAGVAGLLLAQRPLLTNHEVRAILAASADDLGEIGLDRQYGNGLVNALRALETATPAQAPVPAPARCMEVGCGVAAALRGQPDEEQLLTTLRHTRDRLFEQGVGLRWRQLYYRHQEEVFWLIMGDAPLRDDVRHAIRTLEPGLQALLQHNQSSVLITKEMVDYADKVIVALAEQGSPELRADLLQEWRQLQPARLVGWAMDDAWQQIQTESGLQKVYLPLVLD